MPDLGGNYTLDTILKEMTESGYSGTEIGNKFPKDSSSIKQVLTRFNLELASAWHSTFFLSKNIDSELERIHKKAALLAALFQLTFQRFCPAVIFHGMTGLTARDRGWQHLSVIPYDVPMPSERVQRVIVGY
mgnify:CR=1 FL=1